MSDPRQRSSWSSYRRALTYARPYAFRLTVAILAGFVSGGSMLGLLRASSTVLRPFEQSALPAGQTQQPVRTDTTANPSEVEQFESYAQRFGVDVARWDVSMPGVLTARFRVTQKGAGPCQVRRVLSPERPFSTRPSHEQIFLSPALQRGERERVRRR